MEDVGAVFPGEQVATDPAQRAAAPAESEPEAAPPPEAPRRRPRPIEIQSMEVPSVEATLDYAPRSRAWLVLLAGICGVLFFAVALAYPLFQSALPFDESELPLDQPRPIPVAQRNGTLNLVTEPPCHVSAGIQALGQTPLLNVPLAAGSHMLTLRDADGHSHVLTVLIRPGLSTNLNMPLESLPKVDDP
jgi:hypothetical protein